MAGGTCGRPVRASRFPAAVIWTPVPFVPLCVVDGAVFGFIVDLDLRVIGTEVTLIAGLWLPRLNHGESMSRVTAAAASERVVGIFPSHPHIGPRTRFWPAIHHLNDCTVTGVASRGPLYGIIHAIIEPVVYFPHNLKGMGVFALVVLVDLLGVASLTGLRRYHQGNGDYIVL